MSDAPPTAYAAAPAAYRENSILTASHDQLVVMLYDGAGRFLAQAAAAMREQDVARSNQRLQRAEAIIEELLVTLDMSAGEVAERLQALYVFWRRRLAEARLERDPDRIEEVRALLSELRGAWAGIGSSERSTAEPS